MKNKGVVIGIIASIVILAGLFFMLSGKPAEQPAVSGDMTETIVAETAPLAGAPPMPEASTETTAEAPAETPVAETTEATAPVATETPVTAETETAAPAEAPAPATTEEAVTETSSDESLLAAPTALQVDVAKAMMDRSIGNPDAPVTVIEYASLTCPHCAHFANDFLPEVKKQLVETGKLRLIFRDFPLDNMAMKAAMMARCAPAEKYFDLIEVIFKNQERWAKAENPQQALVQLGSLAGMDGEYINACMNNPALETALLTGLQDAQKKYSLKSTPSFIFNDNAEQLSGAQPVEKFIEVINKLTSGR